MGTILVDRSFKQELGPSSGSTQTSHTSGRRPQPLLGPMRRTAADANSSDAVFGGAFLPTSKRSWNNFKQRWCNIGIWWHRCRWFKRKLFIGR